jgi:hypothetical protein
MRLDPRICFIASACISLVMAGLGCSSERDDAPVSIEKFKKLARSSSLRSYGPDTPEPQWEVYRKDGGVFVRPYRRPPAPAEKPVRVILEYDRGSDPGGIRWLRVSDGWLVGRAYGEFNSGLDWFSPDNERRYRLSIENIRGFIKFKGRIYALAGLDMGSNFGCEVLKLDRNEDTGRWSAEKFADLPGAPSAAVIDDRGAMIIATSAGLVELWPDARKKLLVPWKSGGMLHPDTEIIGANVGLDFNSFVMVAGGDTAYIGMPQAVIEITSLKTKPKIRRFIHNTPSSD